MESEIFSKKTLSRRIDIDKYFCNYNGSGRNWSTWVSNEGEGGDLQRTTDPFGEDRYDLRIKWWDEKTPNEFNCWLVGSCSDR